VQTREVPGFKKNKVAVHCFYTDPQGYFIDFWGIRT
jgi:hypothetical protein